MNVIDELGHGRVCTLNCEELLMSELVKKDEKVITL